MSIAENIEKIEERITRACMRSGRKRNTPARNCTMLLIGSAIFGERI